MQIYKNPFEVAADATEKINVSSATNDKAAAMFRHRTHSERHGLTNIAAVLLSFLCNTLSGLASGIVAAIVIYKTIEPLNKTFAAIVAALLSIAGVLLVETIKRHTTKETLINAIQYKRFNIGLSGVAIVFSLVSIFSSWYGAKLLPQITATPPAIINIDSLRTALDARIEAATVLHTYKPTKTLTKLGADIIAKMQAEKSETIERANSTNETAATGHATTMQADSTLLAGVAIGIEFLFFLCVWFSISFYWRCYLEQISDIEQAEPLPMPTAPTTTQSNPQTTTTGHAAPPSNGQTIGFIHYDNENRNNENRNDEKKIQGGNKECLNCGTEYTPRHHKQKYCCDGCRIESWELKTGKRLRF